MTELRIRPNNDYLHTATWQELYVLGEHWQSDIAFYKDELRFLHHLVNKYFIWLLKDEPIQKVQTMAINIEKANKEAKRLDEKITRHLRHLGLLMENVFSHDEEQFRIDHARLEKELVEFNNTSRQVKKEVFAITEHMMASEKLQHLLSN